MPDEYRPERSAATRSNSLVQLYVTIGLITTVGQAGTIKKTEIPITVMLVVRLIDGDPNCFDSP